MSEDAKRAIKASSIATTDAMAAAIISEETLRDRFVWSSGLGWMEYRGGVWEPTPEASVVEVIRRAVIAWRDVETGAGADATRQVQLTGLLGRRRITAIAALARGILLVRDDEFDAHPDLLNARNGVVDLVTGQLLPHDPSLLLTKITSCDYVWDAVHPDWNTTLLAMPRDTGDWMHIRIGQAATGHATPDDVLPTLQGGGANGKSTYVGGIERALGSYAAKVPDKVLMGGKNDHSTEMTTLRGARFALIEETPEARHLNVKRLKDVLGQPTMTARQVARDNTTWNVTHSLFLTTNYVPRVEEVDHGTWRRLALVRFPFRYVEKPTSPSDLLKDDTLRQRLLDGSDGQHEAILAYIVHGARRWYAAGRVLPSPPQTVVNHTLEWRSRSDLILQFINDRIVFDPHAKVLATELLEEFNVFLEQRKYHVWGLDTFADRFETHFMVEDHHVEKKRTTNHDGLVRRNAYAKAAPTKATVWLGLRYRLPDDHSGAEMSDFEEQFNG